MVYDVICIDLCFVIFIEVINVIKFGLVLCNFFVLLILFVLIDRVFVKLEFNFFGVMEVLFVSLEELFEVLEYYVVNGILYMCGIYCMYSYWLFFRNYFFVYLLSCGVLRMKYDWSGCVFVNGMCISDCDLLVLNGVVYVIDDVLEFYLFGF